MEEKYLQEKVKQKDDDVGVAENFVVVKVFFGNSISFLTDLPLEVFEVCKVKG